MPKKRKFGVVTPARNIEDFVFCEHCKIFYLKELKEAADKKRKKILKKGKPGPMVISCPLCKLKFESKN